VREKDVKKKLDIFPLSYIFPLMQLTATIAEPTPAQQIALHLSCIIAKRLVKKDVAFHYAGIGRAICQLPKK